MGDHPHLPRRFAAASVAIALLVLWPAPAAAHPVLVNSEPREGARVVEPPDVVVLEFSEPVTVIEVTVIGPDGEDAAQDSAPEEADGTVRQAVGRFPDQGSYTVRYQVISQDDHTVTGEVTFDYAGPVTEGDRGEPDAEERTDPPTQPDPDPDERPVPLGLWPLLLLTVAAAAGIAVAMRAFRSTRTPADDR